MNTMRPRSSKSAWSTAAVIIAIVAVGVVVAGLLHNPQPDAITIPGCDEVTQPEDLHRVNFAYVPNGSYDNADYPWFSRAKAAAMSDALAGALPRGATVEPDSMGPSLVFGPISSSPGGGISGGDTSANGFLSMGSVEGGLTVTVSKSDQPPGPCFAGYVDERRTLADGIVVDISGGEKNRRVQAFVPDGSRIDASSAGLLTVEQLMDIVTAPGLRVSVPVPS
ncbi:hypothetical protein BH93_10405 [Rhodococcoides fascians A25f]|uniref:hypothetical protein n=1 Tax=Rhodococcoides fascians TaxID=1828 RepID=UPI0012D30DFE|nr:hypothetical protein [Rhodococcus fascians]QII05727.1 hypothetical protein BH93_10405 [Rhodococcus fascians A25f]